MSKKAFFAILMAIILMAGSCFWQQESGEKVVELSAVGATKIARFGLEKLSEYGFFKGALADLLPAAGVIPYSLNTPLFSDYAYKKRFIKVPEGQKAVYREGKPFEFPEGTVLIKNFYYPHDFRSEAGERKILETRLLIKEAGKWKALPYIWNDEQTEAVLEITGGTRDISWVHYDGKQKTLRYAIPNVNQCKGCHVSNKKFQPIGPTARQLNRQFEYANGLANQLEKWTALGILDGLPDDLAAVPRVPVWDDTSSGSLDERARAYLDINCAHCHKETGPANVSGLLLEYHRPLGPSYGVLKTPVSAGRGSGNRPYDLVPGKPDQSILLYRMESTDPGEMMPELGRKLVHEEGVALIREWITSLPAVKAKL